MINSEGQSNRRLLGVGGMVEKTSGSTFPQACDSFSLSPA